MSEKEKPKKMAKRIEFWPIEKLKPYEKNARTHSDTQLAQIAASIAEFGFTNPVLVDSESGIIAGHGRLEGAKRVGLKEIPVIVLDYLTEAQKRAYIIADNKLAENAGWDNDLLRSELLDLKLENFDLKMVGFSDDELENLLKGEFDSNNEEELDENIKTEKECPSCGYKW